MVEVGVKQQQCNPILTLLEKVGDHGAGVHSGSGLGGWHCTTHQGGGGCHPNATAAQSGAPLPSHPI